MRQETVADPPEGVVGAKVRPPRWRSDAVRRSSLVDRLRAGDERLAVLRAPAGYGKTTLARQWTQEDGRAVSWTSLDEADDDPVTLARHLVHALDRAGPVPGAAGVVATSTADSAARAVEALGPDLQRGPGRLVVLDDVHRVNAAASLALVDRLADLIPPGSTLVLCGRSVTSVHLARRELDGDAVALGPDDLAFTDAEARAALRAAVPWLDDPLVDHVVTRSEGWPAGVQLAAMALAEVEDPGGFVAGLPRSDRRTTEYLREEVLESLDPEDRDLLLRSSVLDRMSGPLCDAVLGTVGSGDRLERLASSANLFVAGLDDDGTWYRCHPLLRDLLLDRLRTTGTASEADLRRAAARWFGDHGDPDAAVDQACASGEDDLAVATVLEHLGWCIESGRSATLERWLARFDDAERRRRSELGLASAWSCLLAGRVGELLQWLALLADLTDRRNTPARPLADGSGSFELALDGLLMVTGHGGAKTTLSAAARIREAGPDASPWYATAAFLGTVSAHVMGLEPDPRERLRTAAFETRGLPTTRVAVLAQLSLAELRGGDRAAAFELADRAVAEATAAGVEDAPMTGVIHAAAALADAHRGRSERWRASVARCRRVLALLDGLLERAQVQLRVTLAEAALAGMDVALARELLAEAEAHLVHEPDAVVLRDRVDELTEAVRRRAPEPLSPGADLTAAERRVLAELATHRTLEEIGERLYVSRNTVKSHTIAIYRKLGVSGRSAAVEQARGAGLLDH